MKTKQGTPQFKIHLLLLYCVCVCVCGKQSDSEPQRDRGGKGFCFRLLTRRRDAGFPWFVSNHHELKRQCDYEEYKEGVGRGFRGQTLNRHRVNLPQKHTPVCTCKNTPVHLRLWRHFSSQHHRKHTEQHDSKINLSLVYVKLTDQCG